MKVELLNSQLLSTKDTEKLSESERMDVRTEMEKRIHNQIIEELTAKNIDPMQIIEIMLNIYVGGICSAIQNIHVNTDTPFEVLYRHIFGFIQDGTQSIHEAYIKRKKLQ